MISALVQESPNFLEAALTYSAGPKPYLMTVYCMCVHTHTLTHNNALTSTKWMLLSLIFINSITVIYMTTGDSSSQRQRGGRERETEREK